mgnify:CR=1 FL=1
MQRTQIRKHSLDSMGIDPGGFDYTPLETVLEKIGPRVTKPHRHEYFEIIWITKGSGVHFIEFASYDIESSSLIFLGRDQIHAFREITGMEGHMLRFSEIFLRRSNDLMPFTGGGSLFDAASPPVRSIPYEKLGRFTLLMDLIRSECPLSTAPHHEAMLFHLLQLFLHEAERLETGEQRSSPVRQRVMQTYNRFFSLLEQKYHQEHSVAFYAAELGLTQKRLNELCRSVTAMPAKKVIEERIILEAKRYLRHSAMSIKEICYLLGFADPAYFTRAFTRVASVAPSAFRCAEAEKYQQQCG